MNDIVRFANSVEITTGKKRGRKPVFSAAKFYPYKQERELWGATREEFARFIEESLSAAMIGVAFSDDVSELSNLEPVLPETFINKVKLASASISRRAMENFAEQSEMIIGKPYYPPRVKDDILNSWEANFEMLCKSAESDIKKDVAQIIIKAKDEGWNKLQLEKAVKAQIPEKYKNRSELIARTETAKLNTRINLETYKEIGIGYYTWMATLDSRCRESHAAMNDKICSVSDPNVYYEENPDNPMKPIEKARDATMVHLHPGEDFQCRCSMVMWDPAINGSYSVKEQPQEEPEEKPKTTAEILKETQEQLEMYRQQLTGANRKTEILQAAAARHAARSESEREEILKRLNNRLEVRKLTHEVVKEAEGINGIGLEELKEAMKGGSKKQYVQMNNLANQVREKISELKNLKYVQDPIDVAKEFSYKTAIDIEKSVSEKLVKWDFENLSLVDRKKKLEFEIQWLEDTKKFSAWKVSQQAYKKILKDVEMDILWDSHSADVEIFKQKVAEHPKSKWLKEQYEKMVKLAENKSAATLGESKEILQNANAYLAKIEKESKKAPKLIESKVNTTATDLTVIDDKTAEKMIIEFLKVESDIADDKMRPISEAQWVNFTKKEKLVLTKYTQTYSYLNEPLRKIKYQGERPSVEFKNDLPVLTKALEKGVIQEDVVVTRGTGDFFTTAGKNLSDIEKGDIFIDGGFLSTAVKEGYGLTRRYTLKIVVPKGSKGVYAEPFSHYNDSYKYKYEENRLWDGKTKQSFSGERELILQRGSRLQVVKVLHGSSTIYCKLVGQLYEQ